MRWWATRNRSAGRPAHPWGEAVLAVELFWPDEPGIRRWALDLPKPAKQSIDGLRHHGESPS
jgi:hypothetical protein